MKNHKPIKSINLKIIETNKNLERINKEKMKKANNQEIMNNNKKNDCKTEKNNLLKNYLQIQTLKK